MSTAKSVVSSSQLSEEELSANARALHERMKAVDFSSIIETAMREFGMKKERAHDLLSAFLQWFSLVPEALDSCPLQMLESADRIWHAMILNTAFYRKFCGEFIGEYVDHNPMDVTGNTRAVKMAYAEHTLALLKRTYGDQVHPALLAIRESVTCCCAGGGMCSK